MTHQDTAVRYISQAICENWGKPALSDFHGDTYRYCDVAAEIARLHILFEETGVAPGDKIAFCGRNCARWATGVLAALTYGAVAVPILHDFKPDTVEHLVRDSDSRLLFADRAVWDSLSSANIPGVEGVLLVDTFEPLFSRSKKFAEASGHLGLLFGKRYPDRFTPEDVKYGDFDPDSVAIINYTAGSTGFSKGVMLTHRNVWSNLQYSIDGLTFLKPGDGMVSMLPLAHMFGLMIECLHPFVKGCHICFLNRTPSPKIILEAFAEVRPKLIVAVPLIIEKIVRTRVFPVINKPLMKVLLHTPVVEGKILDKVKAQLMAAFGGNLKQLIIGGAGVNAEVESFLRKIHFPFTVGYGMTECGPLIAYAPWEEQRPGSCGRVVDRMEVRVVSDDAEHKPGVLMVRGQNVMKGYYKNDEATAAVMDADGWMNTGDICTIDADGFIYIRGRDKNMILGPSGQNIYPEEIEQVLNNLPLVGESLVIDDHGKLVALIHPDYDAARKEGVSDEGIFAAMKKNISTLNSQIPSFSQVRDFRIMKEEFEKTPKRSIKRYLYTVNS